MTHCRACGDVVIAPTPFALKLLGISQLPDWLSKLCLSCLYGLGNYVDFDDATETYHPVTPEQLNVFLAERLYALSRRAAQKRPLERCEAIAAGRYMGDPEDMRCERFAEIEHGGHSMCRYCARAMMKERLLAFVGTGQVRPRPFLLWARDGADLIAQATAAASSFNHRHDLTA